MTAKRDVRWGPLIATSTAIIAISALLYSYNQKLSIILLLAAIGLWSRVPAGLSTYLNPLEMISFFGIVIALSYGPLYGFLFCIIVFPFSWLFMEGEWPYYPLKWSITIALGAVIAYYLFPIIGSISTLVTLMIIWESFSYTFFLTPLIESDAFMLELYYDIMLMPITILHRLIISVIGGEFLHQLLLSGSSKIIYLYLFAGAFAFLLWFAKDIVKVIGEHLNKSKVFDPNRKVAISNLIKKTGFDLDEAKGIFVAVLVLALSLTAGQWGAAKFNALEGLKNLATAIPVVALSFIAHEKAHKWGAQFYGTYAKFKPAWPMMAFSAIIGVITAGGAVITAVGNSVVTSVKRIGFKYPLIGPHTQAKIVLFGPLVSLLLAIFAKSMMGIFGPSLLLKDLFTFNLWMTFFNLIPLTIPYRYEMGSVNLIPSFDGAYILGGNPILYVGFLGFAAVTALAMLFLPFWVAIIFGFIAGSAGWVWMHSEDIANLPKVG